MNIHQQIFGILEWFWMTQINPGLILWLGREDIEVVLEISA